MGLILTLEQSPRPQTVRQMRLVEGELVIGRSAEADWRIDDPDMYVSRAHCTIACLHGQYVVTDTSSGGLFIDGSRTPLGDGNSIPLRDGTRLRLGDYVVRVDFQAAPADRPPEQPVSRTPASFEEDTFFSTRREPEPPRQRPAGLPDPFDAPAAGAYAAATSSEAPSAKPIFDDPFSLDPLPAPMQDRQESRKNQAWDFPASDMPAGQLVPDAPLASTPPPAPQAKPTQDGTLATEASLREAFLRGLGLSAGEFPTSDVVGEMERFGREYRMMLEGLMQLLRKRAEEKSEARIAQTVVGASEVNPLKFLPAVDDVIATFLAGRSAGFLPPEAAISGAVRDLAHHHVRTWRGVQTALARMIDRFDPAALESELKSHSALDSVLAGGRRAKLWELYEKRYREIAKSAAARFLGEIGSDFREGYEGREKD
jgi:type VI secretion system protein ImpI